MIIRTLLVIFIFLLCFKSYPQFVEKDNVVGISLTVSSKIMQDTREIQIFLPDGYTNSKSKYPVLYVLDGQRYFLHAVSLQKSFVEFKQTPEFIVVGISKKPSDRNRNYSVDSKKYIDFIRKEVIDYIDVNYRTSKKRLLFGWAYEGGFTIETMITQPNLFDAYIAASPFPLQEKIPRIDSLIGKRPNINKLLYVTSGTNEGMVKQGTNELQMLMSKKELNRAQWIVKELEEEEHRSTPFTTMYHAVREYFKYYPELQFNNLEAFLKFGGLPYVYEYYQKRAVQFGFTNTPSDWTMFSLIRNAMRAKNFDMFNTLMEKFEGTGFMERIRVSRSCAIAAFYTTNKEYDKAILLFTLLTEKHPNSGRPWNGLGDVYQYLEQPEKAKQFFEKAKELSTRNTP